MQKPPNKSTPAVEPQKTPWAGLYNFHQSTVSTIDEDYALETLAAKPQPGSKKRNPSAGDMDEGARRTTSIFKKNDGYHVFFHVSELMSNWGDNLNSFTLWMMSLPETETLYIHQTGDVWYLTGIVQILGTLATDCKARKVFVVDHPIDNALFLLVCDDVVFTEFGALTFTNCMDIDPSKWDLIYMPYLKSLYAKAVEKNYLTAAEADAVFADNAIIFKTAKELRAQGVHIL